RARRDQVAGTAVRRQRSRYRAVLGDLEGRNEGPVLLYPSEEPERAGADHSLLLWRLRGRDRAVVLERRPSPARCGAGVARQGWRYRGGEYWRRRRVWASVAPGGAEAEPAARLRRFRRRRLRRGEARLLDPEDARHCRRLEWRHPHHGDHDTASRHAGRGGVP